jgi:hypothetical protein
MHCPGATRKGGQNPSQWYSLSPCTVNSARVSQSTPRHTAAAAAVPCASVPADTAPIPPSSPVPLSSDAICNLPIASPCCVLLKDAIASSGWKPPPPKRFAGCTQPCVTFFSHASGPACGSLARLPRSRTSSKLLLAAGNVLLQPAESSSVWRRWSDTNRRPLCPQGTATSQV